MEQSQMILCDTDILIELFKGNNKTIKAIDEIGIDIISISSITEMELYFGALNKTELKQIKKYLKELDIIHIDTEISRKSVDLIESYSKSHNLRIPDAVIAATALVNEYSLFTYNLRDFTFIKDIKLYKVK